MSKSRVSQPAPPGDASQPRVRSARSLIDYGVVHAENMGEAMDIAHRLSTLTYLAARGLSGHASEVAIGSYEAELIAELTDATQQAVDRLLCLHEKSAEAA